MMYIVEPNKCYVRGLMKVVMLRNLRELDIFYSALVQVKLEQLSQSSMDWVTVTKQV